jgi:hypothetical protein
MMSDKPAPVGYIFVGLPDAGYEWDATVELKPGEADSWEEVPARKVEIDRPVWILQCGSRAKHGRGFYGAATTVAPRAPHADAAWLRYDRLFEAPILLPDPAAASSKRLAAAEWDDDRLPILLGIRPSQTGYARPCGFMGTVFPVSRGDESRMGELLPGLPALGTV